MSLQFSAQIDPPLVREATAGIFWRQVSQPRLLAGVVALMLLAQALFWAVMPQASWVLHAMLALLLLISALSLGGFASRYYQDLALRNFERLKGAPVRVSLEEDAYRYEASWGQGAIPWAQFDSLWRFAGVWVLLQHQPGGVSVLLPVRDLSPEARAFIEAKLQGKADAAQG